MSHEIKLVQNDNRPEITLTLKDGNSGDPLNLTGASEVVHFRKQGTTTLIASLACTHVTDGSDGKIRFKFTGSALDVDPGVYEGEIEITHSDGDKETVFELLKFRVREDVA